VAGRGLPPERVETVLGYLAAGLNPMQAARAAGVSKNSAYRLDLKVSGVSRLTAKRAAAAARAASPGRGISAERVRALLDLLAAGVSPNQAGPAAGVSKSSAYRLHHKMGGVYRPPGVTCSDRYLDREERYEMARLRESGLSMREVGRRMGRAASTVSRELARNAGPRTSQYQPERAHRLAWERQRRPKPSKLAGNPVLRGQVQQLLDRRYSPEQVSGG
jgi:transposase-like protein